jgi:hypothetical protein
VFLLKCCCETNCVPAACVPPHNRFDSTVVSVTGVSGTSSSCNCVCGSFVLYLVGQKTFYWTLIPVHVIHVICSR